MVAAKCPNGICEGVCLCVPNEKRKEEIRKEVAERKK